MARTFTITCAAGVIRLDGNARGECAFTVTNTSLATVRAHPSPVALDGRAEDWFGVMGEPVRELAPGQTIQVTVTILPAAAPAGRYAFRLDVYAADGGERSTGPEAYVELTSAASPRETPPRRFPWWILIVAVLLVAVGVGLGVALGRSRTTAPVEPPSEQPPGPPAEGRPGAESDPVAVLTERWLTAFRRNDAKALAALTPAPAVILGRQADDARAVLALYTELLRSSTAKPDRLSRPAAKAPSFTRVRDLGANPPSEIRLLRLQHDDHAVRVTVADAGPAFVLLIRHGPPPRIAGVAR